ncbi:hypothetical protein LINPERHAP1_LOCUS10703, partial [Linum perenne]
SISPSFRHLKKKIDCPTSVLLCSSGDSASAVARVLSRRSLVAAGFRLGSAWRVQHGAVIDRSGDRSSGFELLSISPSDPRFRRGERGQEHDGRFRSVSQAPEGEGSLPCDGFNHVFDLVKKGNKAFRDNSFEEKEKERVENVIQKERQRVAKLEAIVTKLSTTVLKA